MTGGELGILVVALGFVTAMIASSKGQPFLIWWIFGSALFIVALPAALLLKKPAEVERNEAIAAGLLPCPWCAEPIQPAAVVCRYCSRDVSR